MTNSILLVLGAFRRAQLRGRIGDHRPRRRDRARLALDAHPYRSGDGDAVTLIAALGLSWAPLPIPLDWDANQLAALQCRYNGLVTIHRLAREAAPGALHDPHGQAFARLSIQHTAHYLIRPDGHIASEATVPTSTAWSATSPGDFPVLGVTRRHS